MATETATFPLRRITLPLFISMDLFLELLVVVELTLHSKLTPPLGSAATSQLQKARLAFHSAFMNKESCGKKTYFQNLDFSATI